jgi:type I restriction enzyme S subunit
MQWPKVKLDSIKADVRYAFVGGPFGSNLTTRDYVEEGVPVIRGNNLPADRLFLDDDFVFVTDEKADHLQSNTAYPGDVIFTQRGTLGQVGIIPLEAKFSRYVISQSQMKLSVNPEKANARFVYYFFRMPSTVQSVINHALTSGVPHINLGILKDFEIPLPHTTVQERIASILSAYDDLIENNRRRMALWEEAARQLYREWFVRLRFPGHEHTRITHGVPEGWERRTVRDVAEVNCASLSSSFDGEIEYVDISSVTPGQINETTTYTFHDAPSRARRVVRHGDIIWSCVRPNRRSYAVIWHPPSNLIVSTGFAVLTSRTVPTAFLYFATTTDAFVGYLENHARGAAYPAVVAGDFERAELLVPSRTLLASFKDFIEPILSQIHSLRVQNQKLRAARDLLLPRLMSGEVAV